MFRVGAMIMHDRTLACAHRVIYYFRPSPNQLTRGARSVLRKEEEEFVCHDRLVVLWST